MSDTDDDIDAGGPAHLRPLSADTVNDLCDRAEAIAPDSYTVRLEIKGFRESRTPWDALRLANALATNDLDNSIVRELDRLAHAALVRELDRLGHEAAGLVPAKGRPA